MQLSTRDEGIPSPPAGEPYTPAHALREAARLGVGIEFCTSPAGPWALPGQTRTREGIWADDLDPAARDAIRRQAAGLGVTITSLSSDWVGAFSQFHRDMRHWEQGTELLVKDMDLTAELGARVCLIHFWRAQATWDQAKRCLTTVADAAARRGVVAAFEGSLWRLCGLGPIDELLRMVDELNHPAFGVYAHPRGPGRACADEILKIGGARLRCVHLGRYDPRVDYAAFLAALRQVGYDGPLVFETEPEELVRGLEAIRPLLQA